VDEKTVTEQLSEILADEEFNKALAMNGKQLELTPFELAYLVMRDDFNSADCEI
jgi:hypothetical protein